MNDEKRGRGRPKLYEQKTTGRQGAPTVTVRFAPPIHHHVMSQPGGARVYLERLVTEDMDRTNGQEGTHQVEESTSPGDVPGQLLLAEPGGNGVAGKSPRKTKAMVQGQEATK